MPRILSYSDKFSAAPGDSIAFKVSCVGAEGSFNAQFVRLYCTDDHPEGPGYREAKVPSLPDKQCPARLQTLIAGSCLEIPDCPTLNDIRSFTIELWVYPTTPEAATQGLFTRWCEAEGCGFALVIEQAMATLWLGKKGGARQRLQSGRALQAGHWTHLSVSYDAATGEASLLQEPQVPNPILNDSAAVHSNLGKMAFDSPSSPLLMAAWQAGRADTRVLTGGHFNGKLEAPCLHHAAQRKSTTTPWASWDFSQRMEGSHVSDQGSAGLDGNLKNLPTRAVTGHRWDGSTQDWREKPEHYGAIHFHDDDLSDAAWETDFSLVLPPDLPSGVYAAKLSLEDISDSLPFVVTPALGKAQEPIALLLSSATYCAYANTRMAINDPLDEIVRGGAYEFFEADLFLQEHPALGLSLYDSHFDASPVVTSSRLRPVLNLRPGTRLWNFNADMMIVDWLQQAGFGHDVITDEDLERDGFERLAPYNVLITGSHPEYFSDGMIAAVLDYQKAGGRTMNLGGNGFYWRISYHPEQPGIIECRKTEGVRNWDLAPGERHHAFDGKLGGLWRSLSPSPQSMTGLGTCAFGFDGCGYYLRTAASQDSRVRFIFEGIGDDEVIGDFGLIGDGAAGIEIDRHDFALGTPPHALVVARSAGLTRSYLPAPEEQHYLHQAMGGDENPRVCAELVFYETPSGGAVFSTGSIAWASSLCHRAYDNNVANLSANVLRRFLDPEPFRTSD